MQRRKAGDMEEGHASTAMPTKVERLLGMMSEPVRAASGATPSSLVCEGRGATREERGW